MDFAVSSDPGVQRQLDRLAALSPGADVLGLERIGALCERLGHPERALAPDAGRILQASIEHGYDMFLDRVAEARHAATPGALKPNTAKVIEVDN